MARRRPKPRPLDIDLAAGHAAPADLAAQFAHAEKMLPSDRSASGLVSLTWAESFLLHHLVLPDGVFRVFKSRWQFHVEKGRIVKAVRDDREGFFVSDDTVL